MNIPISVSDLPQAIEKFAKNYTLSDLNPIRSIGDNYLLSGLQGSQSIVLKLSLDVDGLKQESQTLKAYAGYGIVKLLAEDGEILLLERAIPGESLRSFFPKKESESIAITCECLKRLHQAPIPKIHPFPQVKDWLRALDNSLKIPKNHLHKAKKLRDKLLETSTTPVLLHGDLHHDNILEHGNDWLVIDPKGVIGESAYEVAAFIRNPIPELLEHENASAIIHRRITEFSTLLQIPEERILHWCYVQAVLAWTWILEDNGDETYFKKLTQIFSQDVFL